jgi:broad specificity phosphatase PhoE
VRHADREDGGHDPDWVKKEDRNPMKFLRDNPPLSEKGRAQAERLGQRSEDKYDKKIH